MSVKREIVTRQRASIKRALECSTTWWRTSFGTRGSQVQILPLRPGFRTIKQIPGQFPGQKRLSVKTASREVSHLVSHRPTGRGTFMNLMREALDLTSISILTARHTAVSSVSPDAVSPAACPRKFL